MPCAIEYPKNVPFNVRGNPPQCRTYVRPIFMSFNSLWRAGDAIGHHQRKKKRLIPLSLYWWNCHRDIQECMQSRHSKVAFPNAKYSPAMFAYLRCMGFSNYAKEQPNQCLCFCLWSIKWSHSSAQDQA